MDDDYYDDMGRYLVRVKGLGDTEALFMRHAQSEEEARATHEVHLSIDKRVTHSRFFRITRIDYASDAAIPEPKNTAVYLLTGLAKAGAKKYLVESFFMAQSIAQAKEHAALRALAQAKLYLCEPL